MMERRHRVRRQRTHSCRFLTFSCQHRLALFNNDAIKDRFVDYLGLAREQCGFGLFAWVVMPEHIHLLIWPKVPEATVDVVLDAIKHDFAKEVLGRWRVLNAPILPRLIDGQGKARFWLRGGGYDRNIGAGKEYAEKFNYIHANPVRRGLVERAVDWKWSSARWYYQHDAYHGPPCDPVRLPGSYQPEPWIRPPTR